MNIDKAKTVARAIEQYNEVENIINTLNSSTDCRLIIMRDNYMTEYNMYGNSFLMEKLKELLFEEADRLTKEIEEI